MPKLHWIVPQISWRTCVADLLSDHTRLLLAPRKNRQEIFTVHRHIPTSSGVHASLLASEQAFNILPLTRVMVVGVSLLPLDVHTSPLTSEQAFNILPSNRFMIAHKHHSLSSNR